MKYPQEKVNSLRENARKMVRELGLLNEAYCEIGVTLAERHLLIELSKGQDTSAGEIASTLLIDKSTISRLIARALKKGYIQSTASQADKRKRLLSLTLLGQQILEQFESLAFKQTRNALLSLREEEAEWVFKGIECYARGLKESRAFSNKETELKFEDLGSELGEIIKNLKQKGFYFRESLEQDIKPLFEIYKALYEEGNLLGVANSSDLEFQEEFLTPFSLHYTCLSQAGEVIGGFCIRNNFHQRSRSIANAAYMIQKKDQGKGIGRLLVRASLEIAKSKGYKVMQFNKVVHENQGALKLYQDLGFQIIGQLPRDELEQGPPLGYILTKKLQA